MQNNYMCTGVVGAGIAVFGSSKLGDTTPGSLEEIARSFAGLATTGVWAGLYLKVVTRGADRDSEVSMRRTMAERRIEVGV